VSRTFAGKGPFFPLNRRRHVRINDGSFYTLPRLNTKKRTRHVYSVFLSLLRRLTELVQPVNRLTCEPYCTRTSTSPTIQSDRGATMSADKCPVDHKSLASSCPVDHTTRSTWGSILPHSSDTLSSEPASTSNNPTRAPESLSTSREVSSIPRGDKENWVYPSEAQFYAAMARKNHDPRAPDMKVVVPIHNAVNERAWSHIKDWEAGRGAERCGGVRLVSFKGRPAEPSPKARILTLLGYVPFRSLRLVCSI